MNKISQLVQQFRPSHYDLKLQLHRQARTFKGTVVIDGAQFGESEGIVVHAKELNIESATIDGKAATTALGQNDELSIAASQPLSKGTHILSLAFSGKITDQMHGLYPCYFTVDGKNEELLATQFESHHAREVFPCIDEPAAKATFDLTLTTETGVTVLGNMPVKLQLTQNDQLVTQFETTPMMSTYLLAWVVGNLNYKEATTKDGVVVRGYATPANVEKTQFAVETAVRCLELYNDYFGIPYPLSKCDMVGLPDFSFGAMENWGLIVYRESAFFVDASSATAFRQRVAEVVAHELAHQWFGNLVTMQWWNNLWLNESFASWMANYAQDKLFPDWQMWTQFYNQEISAALDRDSLGSIQRVQQEVQHPDEIQSLFDAAIVYGKGAGLVHMVHAHLGDKAFRRGLQKYISEHAYGNATAADLWAAWSAVSGKDIGAFMNPWISQPGHPVLSVKDEKTTITLSQERFYANPKDPHKEASTWPVPLLANKPLGKDILHAASITIPHEFSSQPLMLNTGRTGFYLTRYSSAHLSRFIASIQSGQMAVIDRLGLLNDSHELAKAGLLPTLDLLKLLEAYQNETSEPVWEVTANIISSLKLLTNDDATLRASLKQFVGSLAKAQYQRLGWERIADEPYFDELLRPIILKMMAYAEDAEVLATAQKIMADTTHPEEILGDIRPIVFGVSAQFGDEQSFQKLLDWYRPQTTPEILKQLAIGLSEVNNTARTTQLLQLLTTKRVKAQDVFYWFANLIRHHGTRQLTWEWMKNEWPWIVENFGSDAHFAIFPRYAGNVFCSAEELADFAAFFTPHVDDVKIGREITQAIENIQARLLWRERDLAAIGDYLRLGSHSVTAN